MPLPRNKNREKKVLTSRNINTTSARYGQIWRARDSKNKKSGKSNLNKWYIRLVNHLTKTVKNKVKNAFENFINKVLRLYGKVNETLKVQLRRSIKRRDIQNKSRALALG